MERAVGSNLEWSLVFCVVQNTKLKSPRCNPMSKIKLHNHRSVCPRKQIFSQLEFIDRWAGRSSGKAGLRVCFNTCQTSVNNVRDSGSSSSNIFGKQLVRPVGRSVGRLAIRKHLNKQVQKQNIDPKWTWCKKSEIKFEFEFFFWGGNENRSESL